MAVPGPLENAVANFVDGGLYPEDQEIVTADLTSPTLQSLGKLLESARSDVKTSIRELSRLSAPDIDGWIAQAKQLRADVDDSIEQSNIISELGQENTRLHDQTQDAQAKTRLLQDEVRFNQTLVDTLDLINDLKTDLQKSTQALANDDIQEAWSGIAQAQRNTEGLSQFQATFAARMLKENVVTLRHNMQASLDRHWQALIAIDTESRQITINDISTRCSLGTIVGIFDELELVKLKTLELWKSLEDLIIAPRFARRGDTQQGWKILVSGKSLALTESEDRSVLALFNDIAALIKYVKTNLPEKVVSELMNIMMPSLIARLTSGPLPASVPADLGGVPFLEQLSQQVITFVDALYSLGWSQTDELSRWVADVPNVWLRNRQADSLNSMRQLLKRGLGNPRSVEKVETQTIIENDDTFGAAGADEDWDTAWDEDSHSTDTANLAAEPAATAMEEDDGDGASAWGWDEEGDQNPNPNLNPAPEPLISDDAVEEEAWGWGDDDKPESPVETRRPGPSTLAAAQIQDGTPRNADAAKPAKQKTVTLRESYNITALPESVLELIVMVAEDVDSLGRLSASPIRSAAPALGQLCGMLLAMYRASAAEAYSVHGSGNMYLYNDSQYLAEQLRAFAAHRESRGSEISLDLEKHIVALEQFGKRAYSKDMESQRTILTDLLDGAQGFENCTEQPYASQCDLAISSVIDLLRQIHNQWKDILSPSALLQSTGSLLNTITSKIILDIEDMSDIEESKSKALTGYCTSINSLEDLFLPAGQGESAESEQVSLTAGYASSWLKFQYLVNILDSTLADIKFLWAEAHLSEEFTPEEVCDLIEALFADSPRRREAINEIRRSGR